MFFNYNLVEEVQVGGLGALAFGCGTTELEHILATQVIAMAKPKKMRIRLDGALGANVRAKDVALHLEHLEQVEEDVAEVALVVTHRGLCSWT